MLPKKTGRFFVSLVTASVVFLSCLLCACVKCNHANMEFVDRKPATCTEDGMREHWRCNDCGKVFSDEAAQHETYVRIPQSSHKFDYGWAGDEHYRECVDCHYIDGNSRTPHLLKYSADDEISHYLTCYCGYVSESEAHVPDEEKGVLCTVCHYGGYTYKLSADGSYYIYVGVAAEGGATAAQKIMKEFAIPDEYQGIPVKEVGAKAFANCEALEKVTLGANVVSVGNGAFMYCKKLTSVELNAGLREIQANAFMQCSSLKEIQLPAGLRFLGGDVFKECSSLTTVNIPEGVTEIRERAFYDCTSLENIRLHSKITKIGFGVFSRSGIKEIVIPDGVTVIPQTAFENCRSLTSITLPASVTTVGTGALMNCPELTTINFLGTQTQWNAIDFYTATPAWDLNSPNYTVKFAE